MNKKEFKALINLLDDPDENIFDVVSENLIKQGTNIIPDLENVWENTPDELTQERLENLIQIIQFDCTKKALKSWVNSDDNDLLLGTYLISRYQYPDLDIKKVEKSIEAIRKDIWLELNNSLTALEKVMIINQIFFDTHKFSKNITNLYAPQNSFINHVLESKKGNSISLAVLYSVVAQKLDLPIYGVNLPKNFMLAYMDIYKTDQIIKESDVLFYINPYNKGAVLGKNEIDQFLKQQKIQALHEYYKPCSNIEIIQSIIQNLILAYDKLGYPEKTEDLKSLLEITDIK